MSDVIPFNAKCASPAPGKIVDLSGAPIEDRSKPNPDWVPASEPVKLTPHPDGYLLKFCPNPVNPNTFAIFTASGVTIAVAQSATVADLICQAVTMLYRAVEGDKAKTEEGA